MISELFYVHVPLPCMPYKPVPQFFSFDADLRKAPLTVSMSLPLT